MGLIADCEFLIDGKSSMGEAHLETAELRLKGSTKLIVPFSAIRSAEAKAGELVVKHRAGEVVLKLGKAAEAWALKIRYPKSRAEKLGVRPASRVALSGVRDSVFMDELKKAGATVAARLGKGPYDMVIVRLDALADLPRLTDARQRIVPNGMIWAIWPKGRKEFREDDIRNFGPQAQLVDVKVMSFSDELSGLKLVIPVALR